MDANPNSEPLPIAILASGSGSNLEAILLACREGRVAARVVAVLSNVSGVLALERARRHGVPALVADHREHSSREAHEKRILDLLAPYEPQLLVLAGYMRIVTTTLLDAFAKNLPGGLPGVINIHPADTRQYQGAHGYEFAMGILPEHSKRLEVTRITVHFVDAGVDTGPIIAQREVPVLPGDDIEALRRRGLAVEHELYSECIDLLGRGHLEIVEGKIRRRSASLVSPVSLVSLVSLVHRRPNH